MEGMATTAATSPEAMFVKWATPEEELMGVARLAEVFHFRRIDEASDIAIAVPNMTWAVQAKHACDAVGITASIRASASHLSAATRSRLALVEVIAHADDPQTLEKWEASGHSAAELDSLMRTYGQARAAALIRYAELNSCPELAHGLLHICGDESARVLYDTLIEQLKRPTASEGLHAVAIVPFTHIKETYSQLFMIGCVDGLLPGVAAYEGDEASREQARATAAAAFAELPKHATKRLYYSGFAKATSQTAAAAHLRFARVKREGDVEYAMCRPTPLFASFGSNRPSTLGGQVLLRMYGLN